MTALIRVFVLLPVLALIAACETTPVADNCTFKPRGPLGDAMFEVEDRLASGCEYHFDSYLADLMAIAVSNPDRGNREKFSNFLVGVSDTGTISKRQAKEIYNRYFNVKFVSLSGDYNTCSQVCPVRKKVLADMAKELRDKELGLVQASDNKEAYYRADHLLKESELVLLATCRACDDGANTLAGAR